MIGGGGRSQVENVWRIFNLMKSPKLMDFFLRHLARFKFYSGLKCLNILGISRNNNSNKDNSKHQPLKYGFYSTIILLLQSPVTHTRALDIVVCQESRSASSSSSRRIKRSNNAKTIVEIVTIMAAFIVQFATTQWHQQQQLFSAGCRLNEGEEEWVKARNLETDHHIQGLV